jgi:SOS-response transcriptional repressor LexA
MRLFPRQAQVLEFARAFYLENDQLPPTHVIAAHFGWASENAAYEHLEALARRGFLQRNAVGKWKFTEAGRLITDNETQTQQLSDGR